MPNYQIHSITPEKVKALADAADDCWKAILAHDLDAFAAAYRVSFAAQITMFPGMVNPSINGVIEQEASVQPMIDRYSSMEEVLAWKMPGAGGGGYLAVLLPMQETLSQRVYILHKNILLMILQNNDHILLVGYLPLNCFQRIRMLLRL